MRDLEAEMPFSNMGLLGRVISVGKKDFLAGGHACDPGTLGSQQLATPHACS